MARLSSTLCPTGRRRRKSPTRSRQLPTSVVWRSVSSSEAMSSGTGLMVPDSDPRAAHLAQTCVAVLRDQLTAGTRHGSVPVRKALFGALIDSTWCTSSTTYGPRSGSTMPPTALSPTGADDAQVGGRKRQRTACGPQAVLFGGAEGTRTPDPLHAMQVRYQLRHSPARNPSCGSPLWGRQSLARYPRRSPNRGRRTLRPRRSRRRSASPACPRAARPSGSCAGRRCPSRPRAG